jgi:hypothetical protein
MDTAKGILGRIADTQGWNADSMLALLTDFVDDQSNEQLDLVEELRLYLASRARAENADEEDETEIAVSVNLGMAINLAMSQTEFEALSDADRKALVAEHVADWFHAAGMDRGLEGGIIEALDSAEVIEERPVDGRTRQVEFMICWTDQRWTSIPKDVPATVADADLVEWAESNICFDDQALPHVTQINVMHIGEIEDAEDA